MHCQTEEAMRGASVLLLELGKDVFLDQMHHDIYVLLCLALHSRLFLISAYKHKVDGI